MPLSSSGVSIEQFNKTNHRLDGDRHGLGRLVGHRLCQQ